MEAESEEGPKEIFSKWNLKKALPSQPKRSRATKRMIGKRRKRKIPMLNKKGIRIRTMTIGRMRRMKRIMMKPKI